MHQNRRKHPKASAASPLKRGDARQDESPACEAQGKKRIRAGEALLLAAEKNPQAYPAVFRMLRLKQYAQENPKFAKALRAIWEPVRQANEAIRAATTKFVEPLQPVMTAICAEYQAQLAAIWPDIRKVEKTEFEKLLGEIREAEVEADKEWQAQFPCPRPKTLEDWQRLASRAGLQADFVYKGEWTPADVLPIVEGYFQRLQDQRAVAAKELKPDHNVTLLTFMQNFCEPLRLGLQRRYAKQLKTAHYNGKNELPKHVGNPKRGQHHTYRAADLMRVWQRLRDHMPDLPALKAIKAAP